MKPALRIMIILLLLSSVLPFAHGHPAYVLTSDELSAAQQGNQTLFTLVYSLTFSETISIAIAFILLAFLARYCLLFKLHHAGMRALFGKLEPFHPHMLLVLRVILGIMLIVAGGSKDALFAMDMPIFTIALSYVETIIGFLLIFGILTELAALAVVLLSVYGFAAYGTVMLNHLEIPGTALLLLLWGGGQFAINGIKERMKAWLSSIHIHERAVHQYAVALLRWSVGISFIWMGLNEKLLHPSLSLAVVEKFSLASSLGLRPEFYVLCAGLVEVALGVFLILGFLTRFVGVISFAVFTLSALRLGESLWPHLLLMAVFVSYFLTGAQEPSVDRWLLRKYQK